MLSLTRPIDTLETHENALHGGIVGEEMAVVGWAMMT
jgi:hypothetical protein